MARENDTNHRFNRCRLLEHDGTNCAALAIVSGKWLTGTKRWVMRHPRGERDAARHGARSGELRCRPVVDRECALNQHRARTLGRVASKSKRTHRTDGPTRSLSRSHHDTICELEKNWNFSPLMSSEWNSLSLSLSFTFLFQSHWHISLPITFSLPLSLVYLASFHNQKIVKLSQSERGRREGRGGGERESHWERKWGRKIERPTRIESRRVAKLGKEWCLTSISRNSANNNTPRCCQPAGYCNTPATNSKSSANGNVTVDESR